MPQDPPDEDLSQDELRQRVVDVLEEVDRAVENATEDKKIPREVWTDLYMRGNEAIGAFGRTSNGRREIVDEVTGFHEALRKKLDQVQPDNP